MALKAGLYKALYGTQLGQGAGVVFLSDGKIHGGDSGFAIIGEYSESGDSMSASVRVFRHTETGSPFALLGTNDTTIAITGKVSGDKMISGGGATGLKFSLELLEAA